MAQCTIISNTMAQCAKPPITVAQCAMPPNAVTGCTTPSKHWSTKNDAKCHGMRKTIAKCHGTKENAAKHCGTEEKCCQTLQHKGNAARQWVTQPNTMGQHSLQLCTVAAGRMPLDNAQHKKAWQCQQQWNGNANGDAKPLPQGWLFVFFLKDYVWPDFFTFNSYQFPPFWKVSRVLPTSKTFSGSRHHHCLQWLKSLGCSNCCSMTHNASECCGTMHNTLQTLQQNKNIAKCHGMRKTIAKCYSTGLLHIY